MMGETVELVAVLMVPALAALVLILFRERLNEIAGYIAGAAIAASLGLILLLLPALYRGGVPSLDLRWIPAAGVRLALRMDWLSVPFLLTQAAVTLVTIVYAWGYLHRDGRTSYFYALLLLFSLGMAGTTLADDMFLFYVFWELMLVASCTLIVVWGEGPRREAIALKYFVFTHLGSVMVLVAFVILYNQAGTATMSGLRDAAPLAPAIASTLVGLFVIGFAVKMAIFPLHLWLPDAHTVAPMPVTIMLAAAMLSMGTYGILRFPMALFPDQMPQFSYALMIAGVVSEIYGALMALAESDIKRIIAYSSVSQMGYVLFGLGSLTPDGITGATLQIVYHAIAKALLFMCVGMIIHATGKRDIRKLGGLGAAMPLVALCTAIGALTIAGTPPFAVFDSEWLIFAGGFATTHLVLSVIAEFASLLTVAYALWFVGRVFLGARQEDVATAATPRAMLVPSLFLSGLALVSGLLPAPVFDWAARGVAIIFGGSP